MNDRFPVAIPVATSDNLPGFRVVKYCGLARGCSTRAAAMQTDLVAQMKNLVGGEIPEYTRILAQCREEALDRMIDDAQSIGANGVVAMRFATSEVAGGTAELLAYGTAVVVERDDPSA